MGDTRNDSYNMNNAAELLDGSVLKQARYSMGVVSMILYSITCVLGIPGNAFVIWIAGVKVRKTVNIIWYLNLAVTDLLCCLAIPILASVKLLDYHWPYGAAMCKIIPTFIILNMFAGVFTLTLISLDRFALVTRPVWTQNHRSISRAWLLCGLAWLLALLLSLPQLINRQLVEVNNKTECNYDINQLDTRAIHAIYITRPVFGFLVPMLVMTVCYLLIARRVSVGRFKSQKALRIMVGVVAAFFVCWMPYQTLNLVIYYGKKSSVEVAQAVLPLAISLACFNGCLNPVLYVFMGQDFKERVTVSLQLRRNFENAFTEDVSHSQGLRVGSSGL